MTSNLCRRLCRICATTLLGGAVVLIPVTSAVVAETNDTSTLSVWIDGWGSGTVTSSPSGINCHLVSPPGYPYEHESGDQTVSGQCYADFPVGTVVTVTATPDAGNYLNGLDCGSGGMLENPCMRTVTSGYNSAWAMFCPDGGLCSAG
ncbi:hypothetical protein [Rhodococcus koreensis]|uniref:hypothetical protein n=1 Tax=Rhodococcus koreensis TaxID=99653 RepID=UPI0036D9E76D